MISENPHVIDKVSIFPYIGFNFKPTDFGAGLVLNQIDRLEDLIRQRTYIADRLTQGLMKFSDYFYMPCGHDFCRHSWFAYPLVFKDKTFYSKDSLMRFLKKRGIDIRAIIGGNIASQPFLKDFNFKKGDLTNTELVMKNGFFLGIHHKIDDQQIDCILSAIEGFFAKK